MSAADRVRWSALVVAVAVVAFAAGASLADPEDGVAQPSERSPVASASPEGPIELTAAMEPYPYRPAPPREPTPLDGFYMRIFTLEEMGGPKLGIPFHCLRCVPYSVDAGVQTLLLHEGRFYLEHQLNRFRALGHFEVQGDEVVVFNDVNCSRTRGSYTWRMQGGQLTFRVIDDPCPYVDERSNDLTLAPWTRIDACFSGIKEWYPALVGC